MLTKEYRIPIPLSVDEYRIAQLYMIQKKSQQETKGAGSGVEIIRNEPYTDGPGGQGQYTYKVYHIGNHLPGWFRGILPESALRVEEEAWNAYPYTRTRYTCPFVERFSLDIETRYFNDDGRQDNVFSLTASELRDRIVDVIDIVKDPISLHDYSKEEDPKLYFSYKTGRGPLSDDWIQECMEQKLPLMCAYKLCKVEFRYWGMQSKIEKFIHDMALRKTMVRAHRQAWAWQDEWFGLGIEDIRKLEREAAENLNKVMAHALKVDGAEASRSPSPIPQTNTLCPSESAEPISNGGLSPVERDRGASVSSKGSQSSRRYRASRDRVASMCLSPSHHSQHSFSGASRESSSHALSSKMDILDPIRRDSLSEDEFYDARSTVEESLEEAAAAVAAAAKPQIVRWSSVEMLAIEEEGDGGMISPLPDTTRDSVVCMTTVLFLVFHGGSVLDADHKMTPDSGAFSHQSHVKQVDINIFRSTLDNVLKTHYPSLWGHVAIRMVHCPMICQEALQTLFSVCPYGYSPTNMSSEGPTCCDHVSPALIPLLATLGPGYDEQVNQSIQRANQVFIDFLSSDEGAGFVGEVCIVGDMIGGILAYDALCRYKPHTSLSRNPSSVSAYSENAGDCGQLSIPEDDVTPVHEQLKTTYSSAQQQHHHRSKSPLTRQNSSPDSRSMVCHQDSNNLLDPNVDVRTQRQASIAMSEGAGSRLRASTSPIGSTTAISEVGMDTLPPPLAFKRPSPLARFHFKPTQLFLFGAPLGLVLLQRKLRGCMGTLGLDAHSELPKPMSVQVYNLFYANDPCCARLEPLLCRKFSRLPPMNVTRYQRFPLGDGLSLHLIDCLQRHMAELAAPGRDESPRLSQSHSGPQTPLGTVRRLSWTPDFVDECQQMSVASMANIAQKWWGSKRLDYALYSPDGLSQFPITALPHLLHSSYWESTDVASFVARQFVMAATPQVTKRAYPLNRPKLSSQDSAATLEPTNLIPAAALFDRWFSPNKPTEKWLKRHTSFKIKNTQSNHRGNDAVLTEDGPQILVARFVYGPLDVVALSGEKVDVYVMTSPEQADWDLLGTEITDSHGRLVFNVPQDRKLANGLYPLKMIVRGDHTYLDMFAAVLPPDTECAVFSIDGSFTASVSVSGKDPKVRPGAVDIVRHWQDLGYLIIYITARPDMQQRRVLAWMAQHNFPHGLLFFTDGISADPLRQKTQYLKSLVQEKRARLHVGYGSSKDIVVYSAAGMNPETIFVVGKASKKHHSQAQVLSDGYSHHLAMIASGQLAISRPAQGNGRMIIRRGNFSLPGMKRHDSVKRSQSFTPRSGRYDVGVKGGDFRHTGTFKAEPLNVQQVRGGAERGKSPLRLLRSRSKREKTTKDKEGKL